MAKCIISIERQVVNDDSPDLSWLEQDYADLPEPERSKYRSQDAERLANYGTDWSMVGIRAVAIIEVNGIQQSIESPGLWGIEDDSGDDYFDEVYGEELSTLGEMLHELGFGASDILEHAPKLCLDGPFDA
jgi:predicted RND superfamily exporter protein